MKWTMENIAEALVRLTPTELNSFNMCLYTRGKRFVDNRGLPVNDATGEDFFVCNPPLNEEAVDLLNNLTVIYLWWKTDDWKKLNSLLKPHDISIEWLEVIQTWKAME